MLNANNFAENKNGRVVESQLSTLKGKVNIWFDLLVIVGAFAVAGSIKVMDGEAPWMVVLVIASGAVLIWLGFRLPAFIRYHFLALPDARKNNIAHTTARLDYRNRYFLRAEDVRLALNDDGNCGLIAGNVYEVFYLPRARLAISAKVQQSISESQQAHEFTLLFGKVIGFTEEDLAANRNGEFPFAQRLRMLSKNWLVFMAFAVIVAGTLLQVIPMWTAPAFIDDAIIFSTCSFGLMFFLIGVIYLATTDAKGVFAALLGRKVEQVEGVAYAVARTISTLTAQREHYYLEIPQALSLEIPKRVYDVLVDGLTYRIFFAPRTKYLASLEVLSIPGQNRHFV